MKTKIIACVDENGILGKKYEHKLLWNLPEDLKHFKEKTVNNVVIMGYNTLASLNFKFLPNRYNIVLINRPSKISNSSNMEFIYEYDVNINDIKRKFPDKDIWIIGGKSVYDKFVNDVDEIWLSKIHKSYMVTDNNTTKDDYLYFPKIDNKIYDLFYVDYRKDFEIRQYIKKC